MWVTIIADASFCPETKRAGYGYWIASQRGKIGGEGAMSGSVENNIAAEMIALLNGLRAAVSKELILAGDCVLLQTDCQPAIDAFLDKRQTISNQELQLVNGYTKFVKRLELKVRFKHVKGHSENTEAKFIVNNICDRNAKRNMRKARDAFRKQEKENCSE